MKKKTPRKSKKKPAGKPRKRSTVNRQSDASAARILSAIVESSEAAIIGETLDGLVTNWNPAAERMFGYSADEMIGAPLEIIASPQRPHEMSELLERIGRGQRIEQYETERRRKDGRLVHISLSVSPIRDGRGNVVGASKIAYDITGRKTAEAALEKKSDLYDEMAHALDLVPAMVRTLSGDIVFWGKALEGIYGWSAAEAVGRNSHKLLDTQFPLPLVEIEAELSKGEWKGTLIHRHRDGHELIVYSHWVLHRRADGTPVSVLEAAQDITEARRTLAIIEEREARLSSILETAPDAIITIDPRGIIQSFSDAAQRIFGYPAGEVIGHNVSMLMVSPHHEAHDGYLERYCRTGEKRIIGLGREVDARRKGGTIFPIELAVGEVKSGSTHLFTGFIRDLTTRNKLEQDLRQAQKMEAIGQLTGGLAHDFNNLLTVISGNLEMLERRVTSGDDREILKEAQEATELGAQLASRLLAFGRRQPLRPKPMDLSALAEGMIALLRRTLGGSIVIEARPAKNLPAVMADPGQFENALLNLAINGRDAMTNGGQLFIQTGYVEIDPPQAALGDIPVGRYSMLAVTDTGTGMTPEIRERAFEPFFTTKEVGKGSGLGLSMVYGFVKQSGGHVHLYSEVGIGTTVRIYLPALGEQIERAVAETPRETVSRAAGGIVLLVEDDSRVRRVSERRLRDLGYTVIEAESGPVALLVLERGEHIDLVFSDVIMPGGMTGIELAQQVSRRWPGTKILLTSGYAEPDSVQSGLSEIGAGWLSKPYNSISLKAKIDELLRS